MSILFVLIPIALLFMLIAFAVFFWAVRNHQFDDLERQAYSILLEERTQNDRKQPTRH